MIFFNASLNTFFNTLKKHSLLLKIVTISVVTNIIVSSVFFSMFGHASESQREIVTIDILKIMEDYSALAVKNIHNPANMKKSAHALSQRLEEVIAINAKEKHLVIMPKQAVIQGAQDITPQIEQLVLGKTESVK